MNNERTQKIFIPAGSRKVPVDLTLPPNARSIIVFCRAGADCRNNPQDKIIAVRLQQAGFGTLLPDLLTEAEALSAGGFDLDLVAGRLIKTPPGIRRRGKAWRHPFAFDLQPGSHFAERSVLTADKREILETDVGIWLYIRTHSCGS